MTLRYPMRSPYRGACLQRLVFLVVLAFAFISPSVSAFPPYRSTDADTAGHGTLELRLGLARIQWYDSVSQRSTPLTRMNFGIGSKSEFISEFEYSANENHLTEGALGYKWATFDDGRGIGVETLLLLPVQSNQTGTGIESQFLTSFASDQWQVHVNIGGFYDPRLEKTERGWRASILAEFPRASSEPGIELFVKNPTSESPRVQAGLGLIKQFRFFELRSGIHFGLSDNAPDVEASLWLAGKWHLLEK